MRWDFDSQASDGLKIIPFIPDINPCLLEGRNGIGKTVAVQLLQLISGEVPREFIDRSDLWMSLGDHLHGTRLTGTQLSGVQRIEVQFTPDRWLDLPEVDDRLGEVWIDGERARISDVAALLKVDRISGNEDLGVSIDRHRATLEAQLTDIYRRIRERAGEVRAAVGPVLRDLERLDPAALDQFDDAVEAAATTLENARERAQANAERLDELLHLNEIIRKRDGLDAAAGILLAQRDDAAARVSDLEVKLVATQARADALAETLRTEGGVAQQFADASGLLRTRRNRVEQHLRTVTKLAGDLGVVAEPNEVTAAINACDDEIAALLREQQQIDASGQVRSVLDVVLPTLDNAALTVGDQVLADGFTPNLTVSAAAAAFGARSEALAREPTPEQVRHLLDQRRRVSARRENLAALADRLDRLTRDSNLVAQAEREYAELEARDTAAAEHAAASRAADSELGHLEHELTSAHEALAVIAQQLAVQGTMSRQDADREIAEILEDLGIREEDATPAVAGFRQDLAAADAMVETARQHLATLQRRVGLTQSELSDLILRLENIPWFASATSTRPLRVADGTVDLAHYGSARIALLDALAAIDEAEDVVARLQGLCQQFLRDSDTAGTLDDYSRSLRAPLAKMLSARILAALNSPSVKRLVFDGASAIDLDPVTRTLTLRSPSGDTDRRPLSGFSTGEQAFAFTQARILDLQPSEQSNRLLVLDEFGAFVSADRLPELAEFLASDGVQRLAGQVVVILPLQVNYEAEIENTRGSLRETYERRRSQVAEHGYSVEELR